MKTTGHRPHLPVRTPKPTGDTGPVDQTAVQQTGPTPPSSKTQPTEKKEESAAQGQLMSQDAEAFAAKGTTAPGPGGFGGGALARLGMLQFGGADKASADLTAPPAGRAAYVVDIAADADGDGVTDAALVGLPGMVSAELTVKDGVATLGTVEVPRLPNLTATERAVETRTADMVEQHLAGLVDEYAERRAAGEIGDAPNVFNTDDVKLLFKDYNPPPLPGESDDAHKERSLRARGAFNTVVHQAANALAKAAFAKALAELPAGSTVMMTTGGTGAGKGFAIGNIEAANQVASSVDAVWDSAGEQAATEMPWVLALCEQFGHTVTFVHVDADPAFAWKNESFGILPRWKKKGRGPSLEVSINSYIDSAKNVLAFQQAQAGNESCQFITLKNGSPPEVLDAAGAKAQLSSTAGQDRRALQQDLSTYVKSSDLVPAWITDAALMGARIWGTA